MLYGGYDHSIDKKGRLAIPSKLREELGDSFMICRGIYGKRCICVYPKAQWERLVDKIGQLPSSRSSDVKRFLYDGAFSVEFDTQGRILIPSTLREYAELGSEAHIIGVDTNLEIWNKELWNTENSKYTAEAIASIVADLDF
ncbi:MAG: division/cell wall cluster transcriptional repressor MraZ [Clostridia bacterium]|nr:division/cell wall cluster transcriptional repressor MraZ [Clostridia bacterium]